MDFLRNSYESLKQQIMESADPDQILFSLNKQLDGLRKYFNEEIPVESDSIVAVIGYVLPIQVIFHLFKSFLIYLF